MKIFIGIFFTLKIFLIYLSLLEKETLARKKQFGSLIYLKLQGNAMIA